MASLRALSMWGRVALVAWAGLLSNACELVAGIDDRSSAASEAGATSTTSVGSGAGSSNGSGSGSSSGPGGSGGAGGTGAGGGGTCPDGYAACGADPNECISVNSKLHCGKCGVDCDGACLHGSCMPLPTQELVLWLRADAGVATAGEFVNAWYSEVGDGIAATPVSRAYRPKLVQLGTRWAIVFDGNDDYMELPSVGDCDGMTMFVAHWAGTGKPSILTSFGTGSPSTTVSLSHQAGEDLRYQVFAASAPDFVLIHDKGYGGGPRTVATRNDGAGTVTMWLDSSKVPPPVVQSGAPPLQNLDFTNGQVGGPGPNDQELEFDGAIGEIMIYRVPLDAIEADAVDSYLGQKYTFQ